MNLTLKPVNNATLCERGFVAYLDLSHDTPGELNAYIFLTRAQMIEIYEASIEILAEPQPTEDAPEPVRTAWPARSEHEVSDTRGRVAAINAEIRKGQS